VEEMKDPAEQVIERLMLERELGILQRKDERRETPGESYGSCPPLSFFRKPGEPDALDEE
jgi:hypothetical protein